MSKYRKFTALISLLASAGLLGTTTACSALGGGEASGSTTTESETVNIGVIYPKTGQYAEYGEIFQEGFELALEKINSSGGVQGKTLGLKYYDTQSDPKQSAAVAPKLASDQSIIAVVGDYSSPSSSAASPTFQQAKLVHYGFNNSAPSFTSTGDYIWSPRIGVDQYQKKIADYLATQYQKVSVVYLENDWGKEAWGYFKEEAEAKGLEIAYVSSYLADSTDLSSILIPARDADPDAIVSIGYGPDGALVVNTLRDKLGYTGPFYGGQETNEFLETAGKNAEGTVITGSFSASGATDQKVIDFVEDFREKYGKTPSGFHAGAYQALIDLAYIANQTSATREGIQEGLKTIEDLPLYEGKGGTFKFNPTTRRAANIDPILLIVKDGKFELFTPEE